VAPDEPEPGGPQIAGGPDAPESAEETVAEPAHPRALVLPIDAEFLALGLPPFDPARYRKWRQRGRIRVGQTHLSHAALTGRGDAVLLAMSTAEATVRVYERESRKLLANHPIPGYGQFDRGDLAPWPEPTPEALFLFGKDDGLWLFHAGSGEALTRFDETPVWQLRWSPDRKVLVAGLSRIPGQTSDLTFFLRDGPRSLEKLGTIAFGERVDAWSLTRDNRFMAAIYYPSDTMELIDLHTGETVWRVGAPEFGGDVAISPNGRAVAVGGAALQIVDAANPSHRVTFTEFGNNIGRVRFSPSGDAVVTSSFDGKVRIFEFDLARRKIKLVKKLKHAGSSNVYELLFHDGGVGLISTSGDQTIRYWGR
jgi:WD40 repeat protein